MRIAFFHELHKGGARRTVIEQAKKLKKHHIVDLYVVDTKRNFVEENYFTHTHFYLFPDKKKNRFLINPRLYKDVIELYKLYLLHKSIAEDINSQHYDIVIIHPSKLTQTPFILRFIKTKKIYYCHETLRLVYDPLISVIPKLGLMKTIYEKLNRLLRKTIDKKNISFADFVLTNSYNTQKNIKAAYGLKSIVSYVGVDTSFFKPAKTKKINDVLFIGAFDEVDGYLLLEQALKYTKEDIKIKVHNGNDSWIMDDQHFLKLYIQSKIVLALAHNEPFGMIPIEAMACGVPVVAVNEGGYKETVIDGKTGYLIPRDPKILARKLDYLMQHPAVLKDMGCNAREEMEKNWTWDLQMKKLEKLLYSF